MGGRLASREVAARIPDSRLQPHPDPAVHPMTASTLVNVAFHQVPVRSMTIVATARGVGVPLFHHDDVARGVVVPYHRRALRRAAGELRGEDQKQDPEQHRARQMGRFGSGVRMVHGSTPWGREGGGEGVSPE